MFGQTVDGPVMVTLGGVLTETVFDALPLHEPLPTVTLYVVVAFSVMVIVCVVAPVDQR